MDQSAYKHLLSPFKISHPGGELEVRNRILVSAHVPGFAENRQAGEHYIAYHRRYAAEGVGMQITGGTPVHKSGLLSTRQDALWNLDDSIVPGYRKLSAAVHEEGGRMLAQLAHSGGTVKIAEPGITTWSASAIRSAATGHVSHAMSVDEINEVIVAYADAATRVREGELDGVEILAAFGFLPQAFLSPLTNHRDDFYGGSLENRMRFLTELLVSVRSRLGAHQILGVRLPGNEFEPGGLSLSDMSRVCIELSDRGLVDYFNITAHTNFTHTGRSKHWPPTPAPHGGFVDLAAGIKAQVSLPVFTVGRIIDPSHAESIIANGQADMVGMTRAHICDPGIVRKIQAGKVQQIRPCVGANSCIANRYAGKSIRCMHNPEVKSAGMPLQKSPVSRRVAVIGAGPGGLEAARFCALRGHSVRVYEKSANPGGQLAYWSSVESMSELTRITRWRVSELSRLGVALELNKKITHPELVKLNVDDIIVATGATDRVGRLPVQESSLPVLTPMQFLDQDIEGLEKAIVVSDGRGQAGLVCAERLLEAGASVEIVSEDVAVAHDLDPTNRNAWYERLGQRGVEFTAQTVVEQVSSASITLSNVYSRKTSERHAIDLIVDWSGGQSENSLLGTHQNQQVQYNLHAIGDCMAPRSVEIAMAEALQVARRI